MQPLETTPEFVKCPGCKATFGNENLCETRLTVVVTIQNQEASGENKYTIFTESVKMMLKLPKELPYRSMNSFDLEEKIFEKLPISCSAKIRTGGNNIIDVLSIWYANLNNIPGYF